MSSNKKSNSPEIVTENPINKRENALKSALKALNDPNPPSIRAAASKFGLAEATLRRAFKKNSIPDKSGPATVLSSYEEEQLVGYCMNMQRLGFGLTWSGVNHCVMNIVNRDSCNHPFNKSGPGKAW